MPPFFPYLHDRHPLFAALSWVTVVTVKRTGSASAAGGPRPDSFTRRPPVAAVLRRSAVGAVKRGEDLVELLEHLLDPLTVLGSPG